MSEPDKTHYRKAFDSPYLSSADIVDPVVLMIKRVTLEQDRTKKTKDEFNTAWFEEREIRHGEALKPMILNATNSKFLAALTGSKWIDDWTGVLVTVYVEPNVRFGKETVEGLRLAKAADKPRSAPPELVAAAELAAGNGTDAYQVWFKKVGVEGRALIESRHKALKAKAAAADSARTAAAPGAAVNQFVAEMEAAEAQQ